MDRLDAATVSGSGCLFALTFGYWEVATFLCVLALIFAYRWLRV